MPLGGFAPLPLPLGGDAQTGWTAEQHARVCADVAAAKRVAAFAVLHMTTSGSVDTIDYYTAQHGSGLAVAPTVTSAVAGTFVFTWEDSYKDEFGIAWPTNIRCGKATCDGPLSYEADVIVDSPVQVTVETHYTAVGTHSDYSFSLKVW